jgi:hypothetical protein
MSSGSVFLTNLDDFIVPSQACVNPLVASKMTAVTDGGDAFNSNRNKVGVGMRASNKKHARVTLETDFSTSDFDDLSLSVPVATSVRKFANNEPDLIKSRVSLDQGGSGAKKTVATVSLNDCLACSGCVTSAETILIHEQSTDKFMQFLSEKQDQQLVVVVQISPNSRASIADALGLPVVEFFLRVAAALKAMGVDYVVDSAAGNDVALVESREEFLQR